MKKIVQYNQDLLDDIAMDTGDWCSLVAMTTSWVYNTWEVKTDEDIQKLGLKMTADKVLSNPWGARSSDTIKYITGAFNWKYEKVLIDSPRFWKLLQDWFMLTVSYKNSNAYGNDRRDDGVVNKLQPEWERGHVVSVVFDNWDYYMVDNYFTELPEEYKKRFGNVYINEAFVEYVKANRYSSCYLIIKEHDMSYWQRVITWIVARKGYNRFNDHSKRLIDKYL